MLIITVALLVVLGLAALVGAYVAYPSRGEAIPYAEWLSDAMVRARRRLLP
ncbi:MAG TPA: hypothetical protein VFI30_06730 [Nocardioidaceae bacterium]|nr:hypothetical protein [Nocardioidaceae bacterium]